MAGTGMKTFEEEALRCVICLETYTDPRNLTCLHTFCFKCIQGHIQKSSTGGKFNCPTCRHETNIPEEGLEGLPKDFFISNLLDTFATFCKESDVKCELCEEQSTAEYRCFTCQKYACLLCNDAHKRLTGLFKDHQIKPISECVNLSMAELCQLNPEVCDMHEQEALKYFCCDCESAICRECRLSDHLSHQCKDLAVPLSEKAKGSLKTTVEELNQHINHLKLKAETLTHWRETSVTSKKDLLQNINEEKQKMIDKINDYYNKVENTVEVKMSAIIKDIELQKESIEGTISYIDGLCGVGERTLVYGRCGEMINIKQQLESVLKTQNKNYNPLQQLSYMKWKPGNTDSSVTLEDLGKCEEVSSEDESRSEAVLRYHVHNITNLQTTVFCPRFTILNFPWDIKVYSSMKSGRKGLAIYINFRGSTGGKINSHILLINQDREKDVEKKNYEIEFENNGSTRGFPCFIGWDELISQDNGFIKNDSIIVEMRPSDVTPLY